MITLIYCCQKDFSILMEIYSKTKYKTIYCKIIFFRFNVLIYLNCIILNKVIIYKRLSDQCLLIWNNESYIHVYQNARRWNLWGGITCWHMWNTDIIIFKPSTQEEYINKLQWQCTWQPLLASAIYLHKNIPC